MNNTQFLINLKSSRPDAYTTLRTLASSFQCYSVWNTERRASILHTYAMMKISLLTQSTYKYNFLNRNYINLHNRTVNGLAFKCLTKRQLRKWEKKQVA